MGCIVTGAVGGFSPSGMNKSGTQSITSSFADISGWSADTSGYPGSTVDSNLSVVAQGTKSGAVLVANIPFSGGTYFTGTGVQVRLLVNGSVVATGSGVALGSGTATATFTQTINQGDLVKAQIIGSTYTAAPSVTAGAGTYVRIT